MRKLVHGIALAGFTAASLVTLPVSQGMALTIPPVAVSAPANDLVVEVAKRGGSQHWKRNRGGHNWKNNNKNWNGGHYYRRGHHHGGHHHGGHDNDDWWWPGLAGVGVGLGLSLLNNAPYYYDRPVYVAPGGSSAHVVWCERRYRSYRVYDNTFQPYYGPRQQCDSPYM